MTMAFQQKYNENSYHYQRFCFHDEESETKVTATGLQQLNEEKTTTLQKTDTKRPLRMTACFVVVVLVVVVVVLLLLLLLCIFFFFFFYI